MNKIVIPTTEYKKLRRQATAYKKLVGRLFESIVRDPIQDVVSDFRKTNFYTDEFLHDLGEGLRRSSRNKR